MGAARQMARGRVLPSPEASPQQPNTRTRTHLQACRCVDEEVVDVGQGGMQRRQPVARVPAVAVAMPH
jgi:hypothetical protein